MGLLAQLRFRRTTVIIWGLMAFLTGLGLARLKISVQLWLVWLSLLTVISTFKNKNLITIFCVVCFGLVLGLWRGKIYMQKLSAYQTNYYHKLTIIGRADNEGIYEKSQLAFDLVDIKFQNQTRLIGKVGVKGYGAKAIFRGDLVQASGKLYPARGARQGRISFAKIEILDRSSSVVNKWRRNFEAGMLSALPEPLASFGLGLLIGQRNTLPDDVNNRLSAVDLTHIIAVSGYNLTIIIGAIYWLLKKFSKYQAFIISVSLIFVFLIFTGSSASIVRAAIVSLLSLSAAYYGRSIKPIMMILLAATITAGWSPIYIWSDIGWYLSFLAFYGILVLAPLILRQFYRQRKPKQLVTIIVETLAAQLMTIPIVMYIFGQISLVALPANILVVPLVPLAMVLSFVAALSGMLVPAIAGWFALPARIILTYMLDVVRLIAKIPGALSLQTLNISQMLSLYGLVIVLCSLLWFKNRSKNVIITDELSEEI